MAVLSVFAALLQPIVDQLPTSPTLGLNSTLTTALGSSSGHSLLDNFGWANNFFPLDSVVACMGIIIVFFGVAWVVRLTLWTLRLFHIGGED